MQATIDDINTRIGEAFLKAELMSPQELQKTLEAAQQAEVRLDRYCSIAGQLPDDDLAKVVASVAGVPRVTSVEEFQLTFSDFDQPTVAYFIDAGICPVRLEDNTLSVALTDPFDDNLLNMLQFHLGKPVKPVVASRALISESLARHFTANDPDIADKDDTQLAQLAQQGPVVSLVQDIVSTAVERGASDIHIECLEHGLLVRLRLDGFLSDLNVDRAVSATGMITRLKVLAELNISERRKPQDGRFRLRLHGRNIDFRMSTLPTQFGESVVLRILDRNNIPKGLDDLGLGPQIASRLKSLITQPNGLFLITGPTGSGKTTTLYAALQKLNQRSKKLFSVEDPIEYSISGVNQVQVNATTGFTFAIALRAILRQDPDIVMIGEIRDAETAQIACRAALIGRMVLSTLHTNSAAEAKTRLLDLAVPEYLIDATLRGVLGQKLIPVVCETCQGAGCSKCGNTGHNGRELKTELALPEKNFPN